MVNKEKYYKEFKEMLLRKPLELREECKNCKWNQDEKNKHKPCNYIYCKKEI